VIYRDYGLFGVQGYQVYNDTSFLSIAEMIWEFADYLTISPPQAETGMKPGKSFSIVSECQGGE
jgi:hypothetical protein